MSLPKITTKDKVIRFSGYHKLLDNSLEDTANQINNLLDPSATKKFGVKLKKNSIKDFLKFSKNHYFQIEGEYSIAYDGCLSVVWKLQNNNNVSIVFEGNEKVLVRVYSKNSAVSDKTTIKMMYKVFARDKVPTR